MLAITDPCELNASDIYNQARAVASKTSRGTDSHWYRAPEEIDWQWHIWFDGGREVCSAVFSRKQQRWQSGPALPLANFTTGDGVSDILGELTSTIYFQEKPKALGVILHVADEFGLAEIIQTWAGAPEAGDDYQILKYNLIDEPREVLADREVSIDTNAWRLLPFWGSSPGQVRCTAVTVSRTREAFLQKLLACAEDLWIPVRVAVSSAPLESLAALPLLKPNLEGGILIAIGFHKFTAVFAIGPNGELRGARSLTHRGSSHVPTGFGDIVWNMALGAELATPRVLLMSGQANMLHLAAQELEQYSISRQPIKYDLMNLTEEPVLAELPGHRPEFLVYCTTAIGHERSIRSPLAQTKTFRSLWGGWARQSFMDTARLDLLYPTQRDLQVLRLSTWLIYLLTFSLLATASYGTWSLFAAMNHPSWKLTPYEMKITQEKHAKLLEEKRQIDIASRLLQPRSRGWVTLEFLLQLFPEDSGVRLDSFQYNVEAARASAVVVKGAKTDATGMNRTWTLKGLVKPQALELLSTLNSQRGLSAFFARVAEATGDAAYQPAVTRQMTVTLTQGRSSRYSPQASDSDLARDPSLAFPFNFEATINQTLNEKDILALPLEKPF